MGCGISIMNALEVHINYVLLHFKLPPNVRTSRLLSYKASRVKNPGVA